MSLKPCPHCHKMIGQHAPICPFCGHNLHADETEEPIIDESLADEPLADEPFADEPTTPFEPSERAEEEQSSSAETSTLNEEGYAPSNGAAPAQEEPEVVTPQGTPVWPQKQKQRGGWITTLVLLTLIAGTVAIGVTRYPKAIRAFWHEILPSSAPANDSGQGADAAAPASSESDEQASASKSSQSSPASAGDKGGAYPSKHASPSSLTPSGMASPHALAALIDAVISEGYTHPGGSVVTDTKMVLIAQQQSSPNSSGKGKDAPARLIYGCDCDFIGGRFITLGQHPYALIIGTEAPHRMELCFSKREAYDRFMKDLRSQGIYKAENDAEGYVHVSATPNPGIHYASRDQINDGQLSVLSLRDTPTEKYGWVCVEVER